MKIPYSKKTTALIAEIKSLVKERDTLLPNIQKSLADDKGDLNTISASLTNHRAKQEIVEARLVRRKEQLLESVVCDAREVYAAAKAEEAKAKKAFELARDQWREAVHVSHPKTIAERIIRDPAMVPHTLRDAKLHIAEAHKQFVDAESILVRIDADFIRATAGDACSSNGKGTEKEYRLGRVQQEASELIPELVA